MDQVRSWNARPERYVVQHPGALRSERGWRTVQVVDASEQGLGLRGLDLPEAGEYVEVNFAGHLVSGRIAWSSGAHCGLRTGDPINVAALVGARAAPRGAVPSPRGRPDAQAEAPLAAAGFSGLGVALLACLAATTVVATSSVMAEPAAAPGTVLDPAEHASNSPGGG